MPHSTHEKIDLSISNRQKYLRQLTSETFDPQNKEQIKLLGAFVEDFEFKSNMNFLLQGFYSDFWKSELALVGLSYFVLPAMIHQFAQYIYLTSSLTRIIHNSGAEGFEYQLQEMKTLYNWTLKKGHENYNPRQETNPNALKLPVVQNLMKTLAPYCDLEFIIVWPRHSKDTQNDSWFSSLFSGTVDLETLKARKIMKKIENKEYEFNKFKHCKKALSFFSEKYNIGQHLERFNNIFNFVSKAVESPQAAVLRTRKSHLN